MRIQNYINGNLVPPRSASYLDSYNPAIGAVYAQIPDSDSQDVEDAIAAARLAFPSWSTTPVQTRSQFLFRLADLIERDLPELALAESVDNGKPLALARSVDIPRAAANFRFYASAITQFASEAHVMEDTAVNYTTRSPLGVAGCISPWILPLYLFSWKMAPALAAGNCVVAKPSEITPATAYLLSKLCMEAGVPPGVLNIVHGTGSKVGAAICAHPSVPVITFTGGTKTGREIARATAPLFKKVALEMGGKNPNIIFADCSYDQTLQTTLRSSFANQGQICLCGSRIFIQRPIYDRFKSDLVAAAEKMKVGDPLEEDTQLGAVVSAAHRDKVLSYIDLARQEGGRVLTGGHSVQPDGRCRDGWFIAPTVIEGLDYQCRTNQEEIFGPVVSLIPFDREEEAIEQANGTPFGLAATVWTNDLARAHRVAHRLQSGIVWVNCWMLRDLRTPFGGVKSSGVGREGGLEALRFFTDPKNICIKL